MATQANLQLQIGTLDFDSLQGKDHNPAFTPILAREAVIDLDAAEPGAVPRFITNDPIGLEGVKRLHLSATLQPGAYRVTYGLLDNASPSTIHSRNWTASHVRQCQMFSEVSLDGRRIGGFMNRPPLEGPIITDQVLTMSFDFLVAEGGVHKITLNAFRPDEIMNRTSGSVQVAFVGYRLEQIPLAVHESFNDEIPGQVALDVWGWHFPISYERSHVNCSEADIDYYRRRVVDEMYKWGGNIVDFYPPCDSGDSGSYLSNAMPWPLKLDDSGTVCYREYPFSEWTSEDFQEAVDYSHKKDILLHIYNHPAWDPQLAAQGEDGTASLAANGYDQSVVQFWWTRAMSRHILNSWGDARKNNWRHVLDGLSHESGFLMIFEDGWKISKGLAEDSWSINPASYQVCSGMRYPRLPWSPAQIMNFACSGLGGSFKCGTDDLLAVEYLPDAYWHRANGEGKLFMCWQGDIRMMRRFPAKGGTHPDWIMKQCYDFFRRRKQQPDDIHECATVWVNEELGKEHIRTYLYGINQDPLRSAVTGFFTSTGEGGRFHSKSKAGMVGVRGGRCASGDYDLQPRRHVPHTTNYLRNNKLELLLCAKEEGGIFRADLESLGHFDDNSMSVDLIDYFIETTQIIGGERLGARTLHGKVRGLREYAGSKACVEEYVRVGRERRPFEEFRRYTLLNDSSILTLCITRKDQDPQGKIETRLGCPKDAVLYVDGEAIKSVREWETAPRIMVFKRSGGLLEGLGLIISEAGQFGSLKYDPENRTLVFSTSAQSEAVMELAWVLLHERYQEADLAALADEVTALEAPVELQDGKATISNATSVPLVKVARIANPDDGPYLVQEEGWWLFRGGQVSREHKGQDFVKVYLAAGESATVMSLGLIDGLVKPGWGCQYGVALRDIEKTENGCNLKVRVMSQAPYIFAMRVEFKEAVAEVRLNGRAWHYFEENVVFFPQDLADYELEVIFGEAQTPHLTRTMGNVQTTEWDGETFRAEILPPYDAQRLWDKVSLYAIIKPPAGKQVDSASCDTEVQSAPGYVSVAYKPPSFSLALTTR